jgi:hypothetical protein
MDTAQRRLPECVRAAVEQRMGTADLEFALASDLSPDGRFGESWLVLANATLLTLRVDSHPCGDQHQRAPAVAAQKQ